MKTRTGIFSLVIAATLIIGIVLGCGGGASDAADVERIGGQCIQVLIAAQRTWTQDGRSFCIEGISGEMRRALSFVGLQSFFTESVAS